MIVDTERTRLKRLLDKFFLEDLSLEPEQKV